MYIWNNMFFSLGFDVKEHYKDFGGDAAAHAAPTNDLQGVRALNTLDLDGLHTLGTVVVDYRGMRVTAQSIVPGKSSILFRSFLISDDVSEKSQKEKKTISC
jgi:protein TIF31